MSTTGTARSGFAALAAVSAACACLLATSASAKVSESEEKLSPRLAELTRPAVAEAPPAAQAARLDLAPRGPGSLLRDGDRILAEVDFQRGAGAGLGALRAAGAEIVHVSRRYQTVTVAAAPEDLEAVAAVARVEGVNEILTPFVHGVDCGGAERSEGDQHLLAAAARGDYGVDGTGVTVGILSDSFDRDVGAATDAAEDVASGDLPGTGSPCGTTAPVGILSDPVSSGGDEGRAMAQIVRDLAPGAEIKFATAFSGETAFADNIRALWEAGAEVIVDDVGYFAEPFYQDGPIAVAIDEVTAAGASYFTSAGNNNLFDAEGNSISSWEAPQFRDSGSCPSPVGAAHCMDFDPAEGGDDSFGLTVSAGATLTVDLQWAEPRQGVETDIDAYLLDATGAKILAGSESNNVAAGNQKPYEFLQWKNGGATTQVQLAINHCFGTCNEGASSATPPRLKLAILQNGGGVTATEYPLSAEGDVVGPSIFGHSGAEAAISTAAVRWNTTSAPESFSSRGPVTHLFGPVEDAGAAAPLAEPKLISKPDLAATDGGANTFFGALQSGTWRFYGTSASAPHAAAVAALLREADPEAGPDEVRAALTGTARPVGGFGVADVGAGLIDAEAALAALGVPPAEGEGEAPAEEGGEGGPESGGTDGEGSAAAPPPAVAAAPASTVAVAPARDTTRPRTWIAGHPRKLVRTAKHRVGLRFRFRASERATFLCKFDRRRFRRCGRRVFHRFGRGRHVVRVKARDAAGNVDRSPAVFRFRVKRRR